MSDEFDELAAAPDFGDSPQPSGVALASDNGHRPFDERHKEPFEGLMFLGKLEDEFTWCGHHFRIRTLYTGEVLAVAKVHAEYLNTLGDLRAYQSAVVAACLVEVDHKPMPIPLVDDPTNLKAMVTARLQTVLSWYPPSVDYVYSKYLELETEQREVVEAMEKALG